MRGILGQNSFLRRGECETPENSNFFEEGQNCNFGKNPKFSRSRMTKRISPLESSCET